jgi:AcrR family transcriptional regulator
MDIESPATETPRAARGADLRRLLLDTALRIVQAEGTDQVSVREVARRAGVSSGAPFRHFRDRNALLAALAEEGHEALAAEVRARVAEQPDDPVARLRAVGLSVVRIAARHPAHFRVMHLDLPLSPRAEALVGEKRVFMRALITDGQARGLIRPGDPDDVALACVAMVTGLARLYTDGLTGVPLNDALRDPARIDAVVERAINLFGAGLATEAYWSAIGCAPGTEVPLWTPFQTAGAPR